MMDSLLALLKELLPVWALVMVAGFGYLLFLIKGASDRFLELTAKQADYMRERVDVVDKSTGIFTRTIEQQEKEIARLTDTVGRLSLQVQASRETDARLSVQELQLLTASIDQLSRGQEDLRQAIAPPRTTPISSVTAPEANPLRDAIDRALPKAIRARDLSIYPISLSPVKGAKALIRHLLDEGYAASLYEPAGRSLASDSEGIWLGAAVPAAVAVDVIHRARQAWPFLKYIHLSTDSGGPDETHTQIYLGGATASATGFLKCTPWSEADFRQLRLDMTDDELHALVRERYRPDP